MNPAQDENFSMNQSEHKQPRSKVRSSRWSIAIVVFMVVYLILQWQQDQSDKPVELVQNQESILNTGESSGQKALPSLKEAGPQSQIEIGKVHEADLKQQQTESAASQTSSRPVTSSPAKMKQTPANSNRPPPGNTSKTSAGQSQPELGQLRDLGGKVWESAAGLKYGPGSQEKHRLLHIMRHAEDQPQRPGKHGVFSGEGDRKKILALIDEAYLQALKGGRQVATKKEGDRTVYTVDMGRSVGFIGGQVGNRQGKPSATKIRLVLEGTNVITAFPL
tara:strand:+ start:83477 stop:84307 length:831 start_codon:yes stop_codon:yes gene_type:complete